MRFRAERKEAPLPARPVSIPAGGKMLEADLSIPEGAKSVVLFAHGSGSSRHSPRNRYVASVLNDEGMGTLLADLLTAEEEKIDDEMRHIRFDIPLLAERLSDITDWLGHGAPPAQDLNIYYFGASTGAAAALVSAARHPEIVKAVVSRGGRPDLAGDSLPLVLAPTLLIVGERDPQVLQLNRKALERLNERSRLDIVPGATHLFEEPGTLETAAHLAVAWFKEHGG